MKFIFKKELTEDEEAIIKEEIGDDDYLNRLFYGFKDNFEIIYTANGEECVGVIVRYRNLDDVLVVGLLMVFEKYRRMRYGTAIIDQLLENESTGIGFSTVDSPSAAMSEKYNVKPTGKIFTELGQEFYEYVYTKE